MCPSETLVWIFSWVCDSDWCHPMCRLSLCLWILLIRKQPLPCSTSLLWPLKRQRWPFFLDQLFLIYTSNSSCLLAIAINLLNFPIQNPIESMHTICCWVCSVLWHLILLSVVGQMIGFSIEENGRKFMYSGDFSVESIKVSGQEFLQLPINN